MLELTESEKTGEPNKMTFDNVKIIILEKNGKFKFLESTNVKFRSKIYDFKILAREAKEEHDPTAVSDIEDVVPDVFIDDGHASNILSNSSEKLNEKISDREERVRPLLAEQELREFNGILKVKLPTLEEREEGGITVKDRLDSLKGIEDIFQERANEVEGDPERKELYESIVEVAKLKADH